MSQARFPTRTMVTLALMAALALAVTWACKIIPSVNGFLDFDFKAAVICIAGFTFGPMAALFLSVLVPLLELITFSTTGPVGFLMNVAATASFCCPACWLYKKKHTRQGAVAGLVLGTAGMIVTMLLWNYIITPIYQHIPREVVADMLLPVFLPFNLVKGGLNMGITLLIYMPVVSALRAAHLAPPSQSVRPKRISAGFLLFAIALLVTFVLLALAMLKII